MQPEKVDLSRMAMSTATMLKKRDPERLVDFIAAPNLETQGDNILLHSMLENLISNAWKFTSKKESARIEFGTTLVSRKKTYFIRDNGIGFDMKYAQKLFSPFQRLHRSEEFPGTGIGLAIVKRIIERHGGRIWAEGVEGQGATFYFTLNKEKTGEK
jgi:light-regulated signal transduction histidine kinase (bacteriophytochrome)